MLQEWFNEISRKLKCVLSVSMMFHNCFKISSSMIRVCFQGCLIDFTGVSWMFQGCFESKCVLKKLQEYFKSASKVLERKIQKCFKVVSGIFKKCDKSSFNGVSRKFCFLILQILHGTHRNYPSRRRPYFWERGGGFQNWERVDYIICAYFLTIRVLLDLQLNFLLQTP